MYYIYVIYFSKNIIIIIKEIEREKNRENLNSHHVPIDMDRKWREKNMNMNLRNCKYLVLFFVNSCSLGIY